MAIRNNKNKPTPIVPTAKAGYKAGVEVLTALDELIEEQTQIGNEYTKQEQQAVIHILVDHYAKQAALVRKRVELLKELRNGVS